MVDYDKVDNKTKAQLHIQDARASLGNVNANLQMFSALVQKRGVLPSEDQFLEMCSIHGLVAIAHAMIAQWLGAEDYNEEIRQQRNQQEGDSTSEENTERILNFPAKSIEEE